MNRLAITLAFILLGMASAGHIYSYDPVLTYQNVGYANVFSFPFSLESGLGAGDYLYAVMPTNGLIGNSPNYAILNLDNSVVQAKPTSAMASVGGGVDYYFPVSVALNANQWYVLQIWRDTTSSQVVGLQDPIKLRTCSSTGSNKIIYDLNDVFAVISLSPAPGTGMTAVLSTPTGVVATGLGTTYNFYLDITTKNTYNVTSGAYFAAYMSGCSGYQISGSCSNVANVCSSSSAAGCVNITAVSSGVCSVLADPNSAAVAASTSAPASPVSNYILFEYKGLLIDQQTFRIQAQMTNPNWVSAACGLAVYEYSRNQNQLYEYKVTNTLFASAAIAPSNSFVSFFWGLTSSVTDLCPITLYRDAGTTITANSFPSVYNSYYNAIKYRFTVATGTPSGQNLIVFATFEGGVVNEATIVTNLPQAAGKQVNCGYFAITGDDYIKCVNVGPLVASTNYDIAFKAYLPATSGTGQGATTMTIGKVTLYADVGVAVASQTNYVVSSQSAGVSVTPQDNFNFLQTRTANGNSYYNDGTDLQTNNAFSVLTGATFTGAGVINSKLYGGVGVPTSDTSSMKLVLLMDIAARTICGNSASDCGGTTPVTAAAAAGAAVATAATTEATTDSAANILAFRTACQTCATAYTLAATSYTSAGYPAAATVYTTCATACTTAYNSGTTQASVATQAALVATAVTNAATATTNADATALAYGHVSTVVSAHALTVSTALTEATTDNAANILAYQTAARLAREAATAAATAFTNCAQTATATAYTNLATAYATAYASTTQANIATNQAAAVTAYGTATTSSSGLQSGGSAIFTASTPLTKIVTAWGVVSAAVAAARVTAASTEATTDSAANILAWRLLAGANNLGYTATATACTNAGIVATLFTTAATAAATAQSTGTAQATVATQEALVVTANTNAVAIITAVNAQNVATAPYAAAAIKMIALLNKNFFTISTTNMLSGILYYGTLFVNSVATDGVTTARITVNKWLDGTDSTTSASYYKLQFVCVPTAATGNTGPNPIAPLYDGVCSQTWAMTSAAGTGFNSLVFQNLQVVATAKPSVTNDLNLIDIPVCFRLMSAANAAVAGTRDVDSNWYVPCNLYGGSFSNCPTAYQIPVAGVIQAYQTYPYGSGTAFRAALVNYWRSSAAAGNYVNNLGEYVPTMIRLYMTLGSTDSASVTRVGVFMDRLLDMAKFRADSTMPSSLGVGVAPQTTAVTSTAYQLVAGTSTTLQTTSAVVVPTGHQDNYSCQQRVDIFFTPGTSKYNLYIPVAPLAGYDGTPMSNTVFNTIPGKLNGINLMGVLLGTSDSLGFFSAPARVLKIVGLGSSDLAMASMTHGQKAIVVSTTCADTLTQNTPATANPGGFTCYTDITSTCALYSSNLEINALANSVKTTPGALITAGLTFSGPAIVSTTNACNTANANSGTTPLSYGAHVSIATINQDVFAGASSYTWNAKDSTLSSDCVKFAYAYSTTQTNYIISCPADIAAASGTISISPVTIPNVWGTGLTFSDIITGAVSHYSGILNALHGQSSWSSLSEAVCTVSAATGTLTYGTKNVKVGLAVTTAVVHNIVASGSVSIQFKFYNSGSTSSVANPGGVTTTSDFTSTSCSATTWSCSVSSMSSNIITVSMSNVAKAADGVTAVAQNLAAGALSFSTFFDHDGTTSFATSLTYGAKLSTTRTYGNGASGSQTVVLEDCDSVTNIASRGALTSTNTAFDQTLSASTFTISKTKGAKDDWSFTFTTGSGKVLYTNEFFQFGLGWLGTPSTYQTDGAQRCLVQTATGAVSFGWVNLDRSSYPTLKLYPKTTVDQAGVTWRLKCIGGASPDATVTTQFDAYLYRSSQIVQSRQGAGPATATVPMGVLLTDSTAQGSAGQNAAPSAMSGNFVLKNKTLATTGSGADYNFSITPASTNNYTTAGRIYIQFPTNVAPRLNRLGDLQCHHNNTPVWCEFVGERFVKIYPIALMQAGQEQAIHIANVEQPVGFGSGTAAKIYVALDQDDNWANGVLEHNLLSSETDTATLVSKVTSLQLLQVTASSGFTLGSADLTLQFNVNSGTVVANGALIVTVHGFADALFQKTSLTCALWRDNDAAAVSYSAASCDVLWGGRIRVPIVAADAQNSAAGNIYNLKISGIPTPARPMPGRLQPQVEVIDSYTSYKVTQRTSPGYVNSSGIPTQANNGAFNLLGWAKPVIDVYRGYFSQASMQALQIGPGSSNFQASFSIALSASSVNSTQFKVLPPQLNVFVGQPRVNFGLSALSNTLNGKYIVNFDKNGETGNVYSGVPPLVIRVRDDACTVPAALSQYDVPISGKSLPIVFDFVHCLPQNDITYTLNVTSFTAQGTDEPTLRLLSGNTAVQSLGQKLAGSNPNATRLLFQVKHTNASETAALASFAKLQVVVSGTDSAFFGTPATVTINRVAKPSVQPKLVAMSVTKAPGSVQFSFTCDQPGIVVYAFGLQNATVNAASAANISSMTFASNQRTVDPVKSDPAFVSYGYIEVAASTSTNSLLHSVVRANANYSAVAYCLNQVDNSSVASTVSWTQSDNGAKVVNVVLTFSRALLRNELVQVACGMSRLMAISADRIFTELGDKCPNARVRMLQVAAANASNATNVTIPTVNHRFNVQPDFGAAVDNTAALVAATLVPGNFAALLSKAGLAGITISGVSINTTSTTQAPVVPALLSTDPALTATASTISLSLNIANTDGFVFASCGDSTFNTPTFQQLVLNAPATNASNSTFTAYASSFSPMNTNTALTLSNLQVNVNYQVFFAGSGLDLSDLAILNGYYTPVYRKNVTTSLNGNGSNASIITFSLFALISMIVSLFVLV